MQTQEMSAAPPYRAYLSEVDEAAAMSEVWYLRLLYTANFSNPCNLSQPYSLNLLSLYTPMSSGCNDTECRSLAMADLCEMANMTQSNGSSQNATDLEAESTELSLTLKLLIMIATAIVSCVTVVGNLMVLLSFVIERSLRQATNYFIVSLAVTDVLIGLFSMNFYSLYIALDYKWLLGELICDLWLALDFTVCLASQYTVFFITVDRYCSVKIATKYRAWRTDAKILAMVLGSWFIPSAIFFTVILGWKEFYGRTRPDTACEAEFTYDVWFTLILTIAYFWVTLVVMIALYTEIYRVAAAMSAKSAEKRKHAQMLVTKNDGRSQTKSLFNSDETRTSAPDVSAGAPSAQRTTCATTLKTDIDEEATSHSHETAQTPAQASTPAPAQRGGTNASTRSKKRNNFLKQTTIKGVKQTLLSSTTKSKTERKVENKAGKALRTITFILGFFVACWTPYHVVILINGFYTLTTGDKSYYTNVHVYNFSYWLCYLNSPINPFCYAFVNVQFKKAFMRIMRFDFRIR